MDNSNTAKCYLCGSIDYRFWDKNNNSGLLKCNKCGLIYKNQLPNKQELEKKYSCYSCFGEPDSREKHVLISRVKKIEQYCPQRGKLLDVGCGIGLLLEAAQEYAWDIRGIEPQEEAVVKISDTVRDKVILGTLTRGLFENNTFDVVVFWSVLEHISTPLEILIIARDILRKGGLLVIQTPNASSISAAYFKGCWSQANETDHLCLWPKNTIVQQLTELGFSIREIRSSGIPFPFGRKNECNKKIKPANEPQKQTRNITGQIKHKCLHSEKLRSFARSIINILKLGENMEVYATKR